MSKEEQHNAPQMASLATPQLASNATSQSAGTRDYAENAVILFDGVCNFCNSSVNYVMDHDPKGFFKFGALQSEEGISLLKNAGYQSDYLGSILLLEGEKVFRDSEAALRIAKKMSGLWPLMYGFVVVPRFVRDAVYNWIAKNRYRWFGKMESCRIPSPDIRSRFI